MAADPRDMDLRMDPDTLYIEEVFTDRQVGTLRRLTPVDGNGKPDPSQPVSFVGETQILTPAGALPVNFEIEAQTLREAAEKFADGASKALEETMQRLQEMRREAASSIVVPGSEPQGGMGGLMGGRR